MVTPMNIFTSITSGDSASWVDDPVLLADGRTVGAVDGWTLTYALRGPSQLDITATTSATQWFSALTATASEGLTAGLYNWVAVIAKGSERFTVGGGQITVTADLTKVTAAFDGRSQAQKALADCETALATFNNTGGRVKKYEIAGRSMEFHTIGELLNLHSFWKAKVLAEGTSQAVANGLGNPRNLHVRFVKP